MKKSKKKYLTNPRKTDTIRISISYRSVPGKRGPEFVRSADLQSPPHKWHGFRILTHNPEVSGSNPLPATISETTSSGRFWFNLRNSWLFYFSSGTTGVRLKDNQLISTGLLISWLSQWLHTLPTVRILQIATPRDAIKRRILTHSSCWSWFFVVLWDL